MLPLQMQSFFMKTVFGDEVKGALQTVFVEEPYNADVAVDQPVVVAERHGFSFEAGIIKSYVAPLIFRPRKG